MFDALVSLLTSRQNVTPRVAAVHLGVSQARARILLEQMVEAGYARAYVRISEMGLTRAYSRV